MKMAAPGLPGASCHAHTIAYFVRKHDLCHILWSENRIFISSRQSAGKYGRLAINLDKILRDLTEYPFIKEETAHAAKPYDSCLKFFHCKIRSVCVFYLAQS